MLVSVSYTETYINWDFLIILGIVIAIFIPIVWLLTRKRTYKLTYIEGKLIRKVTDLRNEERNIQNIAGTRAFGMLHRWRHEGETTRYYLTFETSDGIKSFTVSQRTYKLIKKNEKGIIGMKGKKFASFRRL